MRTVVVRKRQIVHSYQHIDINIFDNRTLLYMSPQIWLHLFLNDHKKLNIGKNIFKLKFKNAFKKEHIYVYILRCFHVFYWLAILVKIVIVPQSRSFKYYATLVFCIYLFCFHSTEF